MQRTLAPRPFAPLPARAPRRAARAAAATASFDDDAAAQPLPSYAAPQAGNLSAYSSRQPPRTAANPAPNAHPAWSYGSPPRYSSPRPYGSAKAEDAHVSSFGGGGFRRIDGGGGGSGGGDPWWGAGDGPWRGLTLAWAALVLAGGVAAYVRKGSTASLRASAGAAAALALSAFLQASPATRAAGLALAAALTAALGTYMGDRYGKTAKLAPYGVLAGLSAALVAGYGSALGVATRVQA